LKDWEHIMITSLVPAQELAERRAAYRALTQRKLGILGLLVLLLVLSLIADMAIGPARYALSDVVRALLSPSRVDGSLLVVVWDIRLPVALMAVVVGAALSVAGAQMQTVLNNPLASPFTLGISAAAGFGASLALVLGVSLVPTLTSFVVPVNAFIMAVIASLLIHFLSQRKGVTTETIVLLGIALVFTFNALQAFLQYLASEQALAAVVFWTMGSLGKATWGKLAVTTAVVALLLPFFARRAWLLTALRLGDDKAQSLGVRIDRLRLETLLAVSLLAAVPVAFVGTIGFIGLVGPHIARLLIGEDQRFFLPASALTGALMLSATSVVSKSIVPGVIFPIGVITALIGVPFFMALILTSRQRSWQ
jgi:iron complex transport system permease protein